MQELLTFAIAACNPEIPADMTPTAEAQVILNDLDTTKTHVKNVLSADDNPAPPHLSVVQTPIHLAGADLWLFAIDDGQPDLAVSAEKSGNLLVGRLDVAHPDATISWQTVIDADDFSVADHWHIFAHNYHWLVFSTTSAQSSYLLKLDADFEEVALYPVVDPDDASIPTNDLFLVEEPNGVAIGYFHPLVGHDVYRLDTDGVLTEVVTIGGGDAMHSNGASALNLNDNGYLVLAPESLNPSTPSDVLELTFDPNWALTSNKTLFTEENNQFAMATAVLLDDGYSIMNVRVRDLDESDLPPEGGALVQYVLDSNGAFVSQETLLDMNQECNRPHTTLFGDLLVTTWDDPDGVGLEIQEIG